MEKLILSLMLSVIAGLALGVFLSFLHLTIYCHGMDYSHQQTVPQSCLRYWVGIERYRAE